MFNLNNRILNWKNSLKSRDSFTNENIDELESHLNEQICDLNLAGLNDEEAFWVAQKRIGTIQNLDIEYTKVNSLNIFKKKIHWMLTGVIMFMLYIFIVDSVSNALSTIGLLYRINLITITYTAYIINEVMFILPASLLIWIFAASKSKTVGFITIRLNTILNNSRYSRITIALFSISIIASFFLMYYYNSYISVLRFQSGYFNEYKDLVRFLGQVLLPFHSAVMIITYYFSFKSNKKLALSAE